MSGEGMVKNQVTNDPVTNDQVMAVVLAGGLARRFGGGDKALLDLGGRPLLAHVLDRVRPQVDRMILNANGDASRFDAFGLGVVADVVPGHAGPLAGVLTALEWAREQAPGVDWVLSVPTDAPLLPRDLVSRMMAACANGQADMASTRSNGRTHPVVGLWPVNIAPDLRRALVDEDVRKIDRFTAAYRLAYVDYAIDPFDPFLNVNTPEDMAQATRLLEEAS